MSQATPDVLDPAQLVRIEALHRGFLFQHLYAVRALFLAPGRLTTVIVESDEDVELQAPGRRIYVQVKHRVATLSFADIEGALLRFDRLRAEHASGIRPGSAYFVIASNAEPNGPLAAKMAAKDWPTDVLIQYPSVETGDPLLPAMPADLAGAFVACEALAASVPLGVMLPSSLVWKLTGEVMLAAAGGAPRVDHAFRVDELPVLFEQLLVQLQDFPAPPVRYRPQQDEPSMLADAPARLIVGYSGAGKTSWVAQSALHAQAALAYVDVRDVPGAALGAGLARELAARAFGGPGELRDVLLPGASGLQLLEGLCRRLQREGRAFTIVLDNAHLIPAEDMAAVVRAAVGSRFLLLAQPSQQANELAARLQVQPEILSGWSVDTIAAEAAARECRANHEACLRLQEQTGGLPLYVQNALELAARDGGDVAAFSRQLAEQAHTVETAQELILSRAVDALPAAAQHVLAALSLADVPLTRDEAIRVIAASGVAEQAAAPLALRRIHAAGLSEVFGADRLKIHDAVRLVGQARLLEAGEAVAGKVRRALRDLLSDALVKTRDLRRFSLYLRMLVADRDIKTVVQFATDEFFHEMGVWPEIRFFLQEAAGAEEFDAEDRFWALDGLVFGEFKNGDEASTLAKLAEMQRLVDEGGLGVDERLAVGMKRMNALARAGDSTGVAKAIAAVEKELKPSPAHQRIFRYNAAVAMFQLGQRAEAEKEARELAFEYYDLLGLTPKDVMGRNADKLAELLPNYRDALDDVKHLADSLDLLATSMDQDNRERSLIRLHALKFYNLATTPDSMVRVGQDLVDDYVWRNDFIGARDIIESHLLPVINSVRLVDRAIPLRSQYAVVLAYCGEYAAAEAEMARLAPYEAGLTPAGQGELRDQRALIAQIREHGPPPQWQMPDMSILMKRGMPPVLRRSGEPNRRERIGRNDRCPCGSGKKFKVCHGR